MLAIWACVMGCLFFSARGSAAVPPAGSWIENRASVSYVDSATGLASRLESNVVRVQVLPVVALSLTNDQSVRRAPGGQYALSHRLVNNGNVHASVRLWVDAPPGAVLRLVRDDDGDGRAQPGEAELLPGTRLVLAAGRGVHVLMVGVVPSNAAADERIVLRLNAQADVQGGRDDSAVVSNADTVLVSRGPVLKVWKESLSPVAARGEVIAFRLTASNTGSEAAKGLPVMVDGSARDLVLLVDAVPANTQAEALPADQPGGGLPLYHWRGEPEATYHTGRPSTLAEVDQLLMGWAQVDAGRTVSFDLNLRVRRNASGTVSNQAQARFSGVGGPQESDSNRLVLALTAQPPVLAFFHGQAFRESRLVASPGDTVYMQADAAGCNRDANTVEQVSLTLRSELTGDAETFLAEESAVNSGLFRLSRGMVTVDSGAAVPGDGWLAVRPNDHITASLSGCGAIVTEAELLIDPYGVVYDSKTNAPVVGARVTLIDVSGAGNGGQPGSPARVFLEDGVTPAPATVLSDEQGRYAFPHVASSNYRLQVLPPTSYAFPSQLPVALQPGGRQVDPAVSYGKAFAISADTGSVHGDVPLDAALAQALRVRKRAARDQVEIGDFLDYTVEVGNLSGAPLGGIQLSDILPPGFVYVPGTTRRDGQRAPDPTANEGNLVFALGSLASQASTTLIYRVRVSVHVREGQATNRAQASSAVPLPAGSNVATATVTVQGGVFSDRGYVLGRVFLDCPGDTEKLGVPGVRLWLETGDSAITDAQGRYHFDDLLPVTHVLKLDPLTLPAGASPQSSGSRDAGDAGSRFLDVRQGELRRADFALRPQGGCTQLPALDPIGAVVPTPPTPASTMAATPPKAALEDLLPTLAPKLAILSPMDSAVLPGQQTPVSVAGPMGLRLDLHVNGERVPPSRIGKRVEDALRGVQALQYLGVDLRPGLNRLDLRAFDAFGNERAHSVISLIAPGALARIELQAVDPLIADGRSPVKIRVRLLDAAGVLVAARTAVTLEASAGRWQMADPNASLPGVQTFIEGGEALLPLLPPSTPGKLQVRAHAGLITGQAALAVAPALRPVVAVGIVEGVLDLSRLGRGGLQSASAADGFEHELRRVGGSDAVRGRAAMFLQGKVKGDTLLTLAYDSEKQQRDGLFRDIQPERYYPVYGDDAVRGFAAASASPLYVRVDRGQSFVLYGDFNSAQRSTATANLTANANGPALARYQRSLTGISQHHEGPGFAFDTWAAYGNSKQVIVELPGLGLSGPYQVGVGIKLGSERVELLVRDRKQPAVVLRSTLQAALTDYEFDADTGRLLFRSPVPSLDADLNPVSIRVTFESDGSGPGFWVLGASGDVEIAEGLSVGASIAQDQDPRSPYRLEGVRATWQPLPTTRVSAEVAASHRERIDAGEPGNGQAARVELKHQDGPLSAQLTAGRADVGFDNPGAPLSRGREEIKGNAIYALNAQTRLSAEALRSTDSVTGASRDGLLVSAERQLGDGLRLEGGLRVVRETLSPALGGRSGSVEYTSLRTRLSAPVPMWPAASVYGEAEQAVSGSGTLLAVGGEARWASWGRLYARHEFVNSLGGLYGLNDGQQRRSTVVGMDADDGEGLRVFSEYRGRDAVDGRPAEAALGVRRMWPVAEGLRVSTGFERVTGLGGSSRDEAIALSSGVEWRVQPALRLGGRLEWRDAPSRSQWLSTVNASLKLDDEWSVLGKGSIDLTQPHDGSTGLQRERMQVGLAWRQAGGRWLALARYGWQLDEGPDSARTAHIVSLHANHKTDAHNEWAWRYAVKLNHENGLGMSSHGIAQLLSTRWLHDLNERWDTSLGALLLSDSATSKLKAGLSAELGWRMARNVWLAAGVSLLDLRDADLATGEPLRRGFYLRLRFKFDESLLAGVLP